MAEKSGSIHVKMFGRTTAELRKAEEKANAVGQFKIIEKKAKSSVNWQLPFPKWKRTETTKS